MDEEIEAPLDDLEALATDEDDDLGDARTSIVGGEGVNSAAKTNTGAAQS